MSDTEQAGYTADEIMDVVDPCGVVRAKVDAQATHTPTPWFVETDNEGDLWLRDAGGVGIAEITAGLHCPNDDANGAYIVECVNAHDTLAAERDWYRAALYGISQGYHPDPADYAAGALTWVGGDNAVDRLVRVNAALVAAAKWAGECWGQSEQDWCRSDMENAMSAIRDALALVKGVAE